MNSLDDLKKNVNVLNQKVGVLCWLIQGIGVLYSVMACFNRLVFVRK